MDRDKAIIEEAWNRTVGSNPGLGETISEAIRHAIELVRSGWQPADPDVLVVREVLAARVEGLGDGNIAKDYRRGELDVDPGFQAALAAYKKHIRS